ncbi:hypothetical protein [Chryseobacterium sp. M5A1_1a]
MGLTRYFSLLFLIVVLSCKPDKKISGQSQKHIDPILTNTTIIKDKDRIAKDVKKAVVDTTAVLVAFKEIVETDQFIEELHKTFHVDFHTSVYALERPILIGDFNGDHQDDAVMPFSIESRRGINDWYPNYAIFITINGKLEYQYSFARGGNREKKQTYFKSIKDGVIKATIVPGPYFPGGAGVPIELVYGDKGGLYEALPDIRW